MNIQSYFENKQKRMASAPQFRVFCKSCLQPDRTCYCRHIKKFDPNIDFILLIHPLEVRRRIATGRMSHLCLENSQLVHGHDFSKNAQVNEIVQDPSRHCVLLYPGPQSINLSHTPPSERIELFPAGKKLTLFVIDGTWMTAKKTVRLSQNIHHLPRIGFTPPSPSNFRVRKQPKPNCYSTIEAIHQTIELIGHTQGFATASRLHDNLLDVFNSMVELQLTFRSQPSGSLRAKRGQRSQSSSA